MKKYLVVFLSISAIAAQAQTPAKKPVKAAQPAAKPVARTAGLKSLNDSVSYAIGMSVAGFYKQQGIKNLNTALLSKAISDVYGGKAPALTEVAANDAMMRQMNPKVFESKAAGEKFLASNKKKAGVRTTASGLQYEVIKEGTGVKPVATDTVTVNYAGTLTNGTEFDNSYKRGQPISFPLNGVIPGWTEALQLMSVGSKYKLYIPQNLGYGMNDQGPIPGGSVLVFDVELLDVKKPVANPAGNGQIMPPPNQ
jgi:FKBP-type peptidyl-prolyl cis-trans isomerase